MDIENLMGANLDVETFLKSKILRPTGVLPKWVRREKPSAANQGQTATQVDSVPRIIAEKLAIKV